MKTIKVKIDNKGEGRICDKCYFSILCLNCNCSDVPCQFENERAYFQIEEPINEEELDRLAEEFADEAIRKADLYSGLKLAFKEGYRKAKEE